MNRHKIQIAHEAPLSIIKEVSDLTDYSYALVHLFETHKEYLQHFLSEVSKGKKVILDNSIFELGTAFDSDKFAKWISILKPTEYIIPDALEDCRATLNSAQAWMNYYKNLPGIKIGVVQGETLEEIVYCYEELLRLGVDKIAISFDYSYYLQGIQANSLHLKLAGWMLGRINLLEYLFNNNIINQNIPHHLLGCSLPQEFQYYRDRQWGWIETVDTSNPVVAGMQETSYDSSGGLSRKPSIKLFELIDSDVSNIQLEIIKKNIKLFSQNCNS